MTTWTAPNYVGSGEADSATFNSEVIDNLLYLKDYSITRIGSSTTTTAHNGIGTSYTVVNNLVVSFTAPGGRKYRVTGKIDVRQRTAQGLVSVQLYENVGGAEIDAIPLTLATDFYQGVFFYAEHVPSSGSRSYRIRVKTSNNTVDCIGLGSGYPAAIFVDDIGPSA